MMMNPMAAPEIAAMPTVNMMGSGASGKERMMPPLINR